MDTTAVVTAVNEILAAANVGKWQPAGPAYLAAEIGIFYGPIGAAPDRAIGVTCYTQTDDVETDRKDRYVQVRCRGAKNAPNGADLIADACFAALHGLYQTHGFARITRTSTAPLGADTNARQERTENYRIIIDNPEALS
jgi:hypothetical protein